MEIDGGDSDIEFRSDSEEEESIMAPSAASQKSLQGDALRNFRKNIDFTMTLGSSILSQTNQNQPSEPPLPNICDKITIDQGFLFARQRLHNIGFETSPSQRKTKGDSNDNLSNSSRGISHVR